MRAHTEPQLMGAEAAGTLNLLGPVLAKQEKARAAREKTEMPTKQGPRARHLIGNLSCQEASPGRKATVNLEWHTQLSLTRG